MIDLKEQNRQTDHAIQQVAIFADPSWYDEAESAVSVLVRRGEDFTTDDIWQLMAHTGLSTPEPRAMGAIIRQFANDQQIVSTGSYRKSTRAECHRRPLAVWRPVSYKRVLREAE